MNEEISECKTEQSIRKPAQAIPKQVVSQTDLDRNLKDVSALECLTMVIERILVDPHAGAIAVLVADGKRVGYPLGSAEGTALSFIKSGCGQRPHIPTVFDHLCARERRSGRNLAWATFEYQIGDILYARLAWQDKQGRTTYENWTAGDALVLSTLWPCPLRIVRNVLEEMDSLEWPYEHDIFDMGMHE